MRKCGTELIRPEVSEGGAYSHIQTGSPSGMPGSGGKTYGKVLLGSGRQQPRAGTRICYVTNALCRGIWTIYENVCQYNATRLWIFMVK